MRPLIELVRHWEEKNPERKFPYVDPCDGGVEAKVLFLQHTPGRKAVGTGFVSRDNPDPTARNAGKALDYAGFERADYVRWNVVPYYISTRDKDGKATTRQIHEAAPYTQAFIDKLRNLCVVVLCGRKAQEQVGDLKLRNGVEKLCTFHCGAQSFNNHAQREHILATFKNAHDLMNAKVVQ